MVKFKKLDVPYQWKDEFTKYPHGHSIFEALSKWVDLVNRMITNINAWNEYLGGFTSTFGEVPQQMAELRQEMAVLLDSVNSDLTMISNEVNGLADTLLSHLNDYASYLASELGEEHIIRTLPNGVKDEIDLGTGKLIKRVSDEVVLDGSENWSFQSSYGGEDYVGGRLSLDNFPLYAFAPDQINFTVEQNNNVFTPVGQIRNSGEFPKNEEVITLRSEGDYRIWFTILKSRLNSLDHQGVKDYFNTNPLTLTYQLAEPELIDLPEVMSPNTREIVRLSEQVDKLIAML